MVKVNFNILFLLFICFLFPSKEKKAINILTTNDIHGMLGEQDATFINPNFPPKIIGSSGFYKYVKDLEKNSSKNNILIFDGGNFFQGHPLGIIDSGKTIIKWMNKTGYDAIVPGKYDFIFGYKNLLSLSKIADFPFLASNIIYKDTRKNRVGLSKVQVDRYPNVFEPYEIIDIDGIRIGILGIIPSKLSEFVLDSNILDLELLSEISSINKWVPIIKEQNVDAIILLSSLGVPWDREKIYNDFINKYSQVKDLNDYKCNNSVELSFFTDEIDIIVSGGENKGYDTPLYNGYSHARIFQNYGNFTEFAHFILNFNDSYLAGFDTSVFNSISQSLFLDDFDFDNNIHTWVSDMSSNAINSIYEPTNWESSMIADSYGMRYNKNLPTLNRWEINEYNLEYRHNIATWNCEFFPTANDSTIDALSEVINDLNLDIIAFQEIKKRGWFSKLMQNLSNYDFIISKQSSFMDQAIIYKKKEYELINSIELFAENDYNFAGRPPLRCDLLYKKENEKLSIINLHMKCCDSGLERRKKASIMLYDYLDNHINTPNEKFIVLGDWNDDLKDKQGEHCFSSFLNDERYFFPTIEITDDIEQASYPKEPYVSFLDHILITKNLINDWSSDNRLSKKLYNIQTLRIDKDMGGFNIYESYISDHLPVILSF